MVVVLSALNTNQASLPPLLNEIERAFVLENSFHAVCNFQSIFSSLFHRQLFSKRKKHDHDDSGAIPRKLYFVCNALRIRVQNWRELTFLLVYQWFGGWWWWFFSVSCRCLRFFGYLTFSIMHLCMYDCKAANSGYLRISIGGILNHSRSFLIVALLCNTQIWRGFSATWSKWEVKVGNKETRKYKERFTLPFFTRKFIRFIFYEYMRTEKGKRRVNPNLAVKYK